MIVFITTLLKKHVFRNKQEVSYLNMLELKYETKTEKNVEMKFSIQDIQ